MRLKEGDEAPGFALPTDDGSTVSLKDFKGKN
jgi:peroxiredoxin